MSNSTEAVVAEYFAALRALDVERCMAVFAANAEQHDPVGAPPNVGQVAIRAFLTKTFEAFQELDMIEDQVYANGTSAAVIWTAKGVARSGKQVAFEGVDVIDCDESGKIKTLRAFWDAAPVMVALQP